jgi:hypothetical protein
LSRQARAKLHCFVTESHRTKTQLQ